MINREATQISVLLKTGKLQKTLNAPFQFLCLFKDFLISAIFISLPLASASFRLCCLCLLRLIFRDSFYSDFILLAGDPYLVTYGKS